MMKSYEIHIDDLYRIFFGEVPLIFLIEVIIRTAIIYLVLMVSIRAMGKRMSSQLSRNELAAMVSLAAAIGVPIQTPDRGLLPVLIIAGVIIAYQQLIALKVNKDQKFEEISQDKLDILISDGVMDLATMRRARISHERLFAQLRYAGIKHLGTIKRYYLEANGSFSMVKNAETKPGLCILPTWDRDFRNKMRVVSDKCACQNCGNMTSKLPTCEELCEICGRQEWSSAVK